MTRDVGSHRPGQPTSRLPSTPDRGTEDIKKNKNIFVFFVMLRRRMREIVLMMTV